MEKKKTLTSYSQYWLLQDMKKRCYNKKFKYYYLYGGRGIGICDDWLQNPRKFVDWCILNNYKKGLFIDRIDPNGNYNEKNCRFVDAHINAANTRLLGKNNNSGFRGVSKHKYKNKIKWRARVSYKGNIISLGVYEDKVSAAIAYNNYLDENKLDYYPRNKIKDRLV